MTLLRMIERIRQPSYGFEPKPTPEPNGPPVTRSHEIKLHRLVAQL